MVFGLGTVQLNDNEPYLIVPMNWDSSLLSLPDSANELGQQFAEGEKLQNFKRSQEQHKCDKECVRLIPGHQQVKVHMFS